MIERLAARHDRSTFACGKPLLDRFLRELAGQYDRRDLGRTFVLTQPESPRILGYSTLCAGSLPFATLPPALTRRLPRHAIPTFVLGRLAVDQSVRGQGFGTTLLRDVFAKAFEAGHLVAAAGIEVLAIDDDAAAFYRKFGFVQLSDQKHHLFLPLDVARQSIRPPD